MLRALMLSLAVGRSAACSRHSDCSGDRYCDSSNNCYSCDWIREHSCDAYNGDCSVCTSGSGSQTQGGCTWGAQSLKFAVSPCSPKLISIPNRMNGRLAFQGSERFSCTHEFSADSADFDIRYASVNRDSKLARRSPPTRPR